MSMKHALSGVAAAAALALAIPLSAQASAIAEVQYTYEFSANCVDCAIAAEAANYPIHATLVLSEAVGANTPSFVSFHYDGSNLVEAYTVANDLDLTDHQLFTLLTSINGFQGGTVDAVWNLTLAFGDGLFFVAESSGSWATCAPGVDGYYTSSQSCSSSFDPWNQNNDFGRNAVFTGPNGGTVPEPTTLALLGLAGLMAGTTSRRRRSA